MCNMQGLALNSNQIGDAGITALATAVGNGALAQCTFINLSMNQIGDAGLSALAGALSSRALASLEVLNLRGNQIGDAGLSALAAAVGEGALASLKELIADHGPLGVDHPKLKAACQSWGITMRGA